MRLVENPPNPFETAYREWLGAPPPARLEVYEERAASILSENDSPDVPFRYSVNPYRGCQHACAYCYARPSHEYLSLGAGSDFETRLFAKINAPELLAAAFNRRAWRRETVVFSGITDCYQPLEAVYGLTRRCLEVCRENANPAGIITKSYLIIRDIDVLADLVRRTAVRVHLSIPFADDATARKVEPGAPPPSRRFEAMRRLSAAGIPVGIMIAPVIPGLNDRDIPTLLERAVDCGAEQAGHVPLRLPGNVREVFLTRMGRELPLAAARIESRIRDMRSGRLNDPRFGSRMSGAGPYWESVERLFEMQCTRLGLDCGQRWKRRAPDAAVAGARQLSLF